MRRPVAIASSTRHGVHREGMRPDVEAYSGFFDLLRAEGGRTQAVGTLSGTSLRDFGALLLGAPMAEYSDDEVHAGSIAGIQSPRRRRGTSTRRCATGPGR